MAGYYRRSRARYSRSRGWRRGRYRRRRGPKASIAKRLAPFRGLGYHTQARPNEITYCSHAYNNYAGGVEISGSVEIKAVRLTEAYDVIWQISGGTNPPPLWPVLSIRWNAYAVLKSRTTITLRCHTADATPGVVYGSWLLYAVPGNSATTAPVDQRRSRFLLSRGLTRTRSSTLFSLLWVRRLSRCRMFTTCGIAMASRTFWRRRRCIGASRIVGMLLAGTVIFG